ncbi:MAG: TraR/DksA family transcriptional regulator [Sphingomonadaceae bacterium]|nr:TraR/DksA family transcriptional regulator [Sphingomonadaceae bacterium]MCP5391044.1 TraR/DksA family transcriptional regulator [Sphingomonadaceae bacterium]MCP5393982.1 TraR/DksA family transcriptional regulator [Sphingomonadaceae bacterium]
MADYSGLESELRERLAALIERADVIEADLRHPLDADSEEQAIDLADDEALEGVDDVLRAEIQQVRYALARIENGTYGTCAQCGEPIARERLQARPIATRCINCA